MTWATKRRPFIVAEKVVELIRYVEENEVNEARIDIVGISLLRRLTAHAHSLQNFSVEIEPSADPDFLYYYSGD